MDVHASPAALPELGLQALSSENLLSAFSEDAPHRYRSDPISTRLCMVN
jgi:hypothetical protein